MKIQFLRLKQTSWNTAITGYLLKNAAIIPHFWKQKHEKVRQTEWKPTVTGTFKERNCNSVLLENMKNKSKIPLYVNESSRHGIQN